MPILKQSPVSHSKKRPRLDRAMISAPLGDFRHTMHIGRGGDAFGDTSFLSNHGGSKTNGLPPEVAVSPGTPSNPGDVSGHFERLSSPGSGNGVLQSPAMSTPDGSFMVHPGMEEQQLQKSSNGDDWDLQQRFSLESSTLEHAESLLSFQLDLGPSILEDVLGVMDKDWDSVKGEEQEPLRDESSSPVAHLHQAAAREEEEEEEEEKEEEEEEEEDDDEEEGQGYSFEDEQDEEIGL